MLLENKGAVVTGGSRGIGRAVAEALAAEGATVAVIYAGNTKAAEDTVRAIEEAGGKAFAVQCDVADEAAVTDMVKMVHEKLGTIDVFVNNAGITRDGLLMRMKREDWDAVLSTNLTGVYNCTKAVTKIMMKQRSGSIISMTSVVGETGNAGQANYAAAKAGVAGMSRALAREVASRGITVNCVAPGFIETDMTRALPEEQVAALKQQIPSGRLGQADDIAAAVLYLASPAASYVTGVTLPVNGGMYMV